MNTLLLFSSESTDELRVHLPITHAPEQLVVGDTFYLEIFGNLGDATVLGRRWNAPHNRCAISCKVSQFLLKKLIDLGTQISGHIDAYELPEQRWE